MADQTFESFTPEQLAFFQKFAEMNALGKAGDISFVPPPGTISVPAEQWPPPHVEALMKPKPVPSLFQGAWDQAEALAQNRK